MPGMKILFWLRGGNKNPFMLAPLPIPEAVKKFRHRKIGGLGMPGEGATKEAFTSIHSIFS
jgi:hypothetical protein